ncbi:MAG: histidinol-phosphatase HisJ family protein [Pseudomonadota bacterium]
MLTSYHNHSRHSDGAETAARMCAVAAELGFAEFGITDHLVIDPQGRAPRWSMDPADLGAYLDGIGALKGGTPRVFTGIELDWVPERLADIAAVVADPRLDYAIGSVHRIGGQHVDTLADGIALLGPEARAAFFARYWEEVRAMAASGLFQVAGHIDLPKKLLGRPGAAKEGGVRSDGASAAAQLRSGRPGAADERAARSDGASAADQLRSPAADLCDAPGWEAALDAIAAAGMVVEVNTAGWAMSCREGYPSNRLLSACLNRGIPVTINGDAHRPEQIIAHFRDATALLREVGYREVALLGEPELRFQPLAAFERALEG